MKGAFRFPLYSGGSLPDASVFCPANGYIIDPTIYEPPVDVGTPNSEEIILLCSNESPGMVSVRVTTSSGQYNTSVYDSDNVLISNVNTNSNTIYNYTFPTSAEKEYFTVRITPVTTGSTITVFTTYNTVSGQSYNWPVEQAKFNTPNITTLSNAFRTVPKLKEVIFNCTLGSLTTMASMFESGGCLKFTFPNLTYTALTTIVNMFYNNSVVKEINMVNANLPALTTMANFARNGVALERITLPTAAMNALTNITYMLSGCASLKGIIIFPDMTSLPTSGMTSCCASTTQLYEAIFSSIATGQVFNYSSYFSGSGIKKLKFPENTALTQESSSILCDVTHYTMPGILGAASNIPIWTTPNKISFTGDADNSAQTAANQFDFNILGANVETINCPKMRCNRFVVGLTGANCKATTINIDWANSSFATTSVKLYAKLDATELNRIFGLLPAMAGTIFIKGNPGTATCDQSIATAKGWTVNTTT